MSYNSGRRGSGGSGYASSSGSLKPYQSQPTSSYMVPASALSSLMYRGSSGPTLTPTQAAYLNPSNSSSSASGLSSSSKSPLGSQSRNTSANRSRSIHGTNPTSTSYGRSRYDIEADRPTTTASSTTTYSSTPSYRTSRASSVSSASSAFSEKADSENTEHDWKKMYEKEKAENDKLRKKLQAVENDLEEMKTTSSGRSTASSSSEAEKRERRAMERKMAEMEEELKELEQLRADNQRLKEENGALIRVISKLSK